MIGTELSHLQIVKDSIAGKRQVDEQTLASLAILSERLARLQRTDSTFAKVTFSAAAHKLKKQRQTAAALS